MTFLSRSAKKNKGKQLYFHNKLIEACIQLRYEMGTCLYALSCVVFGSSSTLILCVLSSNICDLVVKIP